LDIDGPSRCQGREERETRQKVLRETDGKGYDNKNKYKSKEEERRNKIKVEYGPRHSSGG
jgi:hypothetical protein